MVSSSATPKPKLRLKLLSRLRASLQSFASLISETGMQHWRHADHHANSSFANLMDGAAWASTCCDRHCLAEQRMVVYPRLTGMILVISGCHRHLHGSGPVFSLGLRSLMTLLGVRMKWHRRNPSS